MLGKNDKQLNMEPALQGFFIPECCDIYISLVTIDTLEEVL